MNLEEKTVEKRYVFQGKIMSVRLDDVKLPDDTLAQREIVEHSGGAAVLYVNDGKIAFVKQYRYAYGETVLEIPAGKLEKGEDPKRAALRELQEETGVCAKDAKLLFTLYPSPGYTDEIIYIYQAFDGVQGERCLDEGEFLSVEWLTLSQAKERLLGGKLHDSKTIVALQAFFLSLA